MLLLRVLSVETPWAYSPSYTAESVASSALIYTESFLCLSNRKMNED